MKITLFTANQSRHNYFVNILSNIAKELFVIQENRTIFPGIVPGRYPATDAMKEYFSKVSNAQKELFGNSCIYLDGEKPIGVESTIIDLTENTPRIVRIGALYGSILEDIIGN